MKSHSTTPPPQHVQGRNSFVAPFHSRSSRRSFLTAFTLFLLVAAGTFPAESAPAVKAATTTTMVRDMVLEIGGDRVEVTGLMGPGVDPHLYKPAAKDVRVLSGADVIFYSGLLLEGKMSNLLDRMSKLGKKVFAVTDALPPERLLSSETYQGQHDPHVWGDPALWVLCIDVVVKGLEEVDPPGSDQYRENAESLKKRYLELHAWAKKRIQEIPEPQRILITSHDAFRYFGRAYGLQVVGVQGISTVSEAGLADIARTVDFIKAHAVKAVFVESSVSPAAIERISQDAGVKIGGELFSDALGTLGQMESSHGEEYDVGTYVGMIKHNVNSIVDGLK